MKPFYATKQKHHKEELYSIHSLSGDGDPVTPNTSDIEVAKIVYESYVKMTNEMRFVKPPYQTGDMWSQIININKKDFYDSINSGNIKSIAFVLSNFFKTSAIMGLWEGGEYSKIIGDIARQKHFFESTKRNYEFWKVLMNGDCYSQEFNFSPEIVALPNVGNPWGCKIDNAIVSTAQFKLNYHARKVFDLVASKKNPVVLEIGGGFGGLGYYLFKMGFEGTYLNFDVPETLLLSKYFLLRSMSDKRIRIFNGQYKKSVDYVKDLPDNDIILMPNFMLPKLSDLSVDVVVNTRSFSEIPFQTLKEYFFQIDRICNHYIYHDNANYKSHEFEMPAYKFPISSSFKLLTKNNSVWYGGQLPNRFVEFLYERK